MKIKLTLALFLVSSILFADGGDDASTSKCSIHDMDITHDIFYNSVDGELTVLDKKGKAFKYEVTTNISIYDIKTQKTTYLFTDSLKEKINEFYFESHYDSLNKRMAFNLDDQNYDGDDMVGNNNLKCRAPSDKLFILTYSYESQRYSMWTADKTGKDLVRIHEFSSNTNYYFDVKNMVIRFVKQIGKKIETLDIKY